MRGTLGLAAR
uniref:Uncharacterized protein n=1 Tax=Anguilla anguilla TaxID=7936 RepID=A0A0E9TZX4_ANGAN